VELPAASKKLKLIGYPFSPYVRKVLITLEHKGLAYELDPLNPFTERQRLLPINPQGSVPVLVADGKPMVESSDICHRLDELQPEPPIYPTEPANRVRAEEMEQWADATLVGIFGAGMFFQRIIKPLLIGSEGDEDLVETNLRDNAPPLLAKLESMVPNEGFLFGRFNIADITITGWLRLGMLSGCGIDPTKYPLLADYLRRSYAVPAYARVIARENALDVIQRARAAYASGYEIIE
jgi:glutathione S-transferase